MAKVRTFFRVAFIVGMVKSRTDTRESVRVDLIGTEGWVGDASSLTLLRSSAALFTAIT